MQCSLSWPPKFHTLQHSSPRDTFKLKYDHVIPYPKPILSPHFTPSQSLQKFPGPCDLAPDNFWPHVHFSPLLIPLQSHWPLRVAMSTISGPLLLLYQLPGTHFFQVSSWLIPSPPSPPLILYLDTTFFTIPHPTTFFPHTYTPNVTYFVFKKQLCSMYHSLTY